MPLRFGLEEEVFITEPDRPSLQSLYYLARLVWSSPGRYYTHTHCNFTRGRDLHYGLMSGVEISTGVHGDPHTLVADLAERRAALARVTPGLLVPVGHLLDRPEPTNICGLHLHCSGFADPDLAYRNLVYFLPLLVLLVANAPGWRGVYFGPSYRLAEAFAVGALRSDRYYRFQDLIISRRLGTLEIRAFDPVWDLERVRLLVSCVAAILGTEREYRGSVETYNRLRLVVAREGYVEELHPIYRQLAELVEIPERLFQEPPALTTWQLLQSHGLIGAYSALDSAYRGGPLVPVRVPRMRINPLKVIAGVCGYALPRLPYNLRKVWLEW